MWAGCGASTQRPDCFYYDEPGLRRLEMVEDAWVLNSLRL